jgi:L-serine/L-threonine ammonia-lyase
MSFSIHTPLIESRPLSQKCGTRVFAKMDALQPSGSFKIRGIGYAAKRHAVQGAQRFYFVIWRKCGFGSGLCGACIGPACVGGGAGNNTATCD